jgi:hypothetical protein
MFVSNEAVGSVIGRRGAKINEIRAMSGARINVLESGTKGRGGGGRGGSPEPDRERIIGKLAPLPVVLWIRSFLASRIRLRIRTSVRISKKNLDSYCFGNSFWHFFKNDVKVGSFNK